MSYALALRNINLSKPTFKKKWHLWICQQIFKENLIILLFCRVLEKDVLCSFLYLKMSLVILGDLFSLSTAVKIAFSTSEVSKLK